MWIDGQWVLVDSWWAQFCGGEGGGGGDEGQSSVGPLTNTTTGLRGRPVQVALVPDREFYYGDAKSVIIREAERSVILLRESAATVSALTGACRDLSVMERRGVGSGQYMIASIKSRGAPRQRPVAGAATIVKDLRNAPQVRHAGIGSYRTVELDDQAIAKLACR